MPKLKEIKKKGCPEVVDILRSRPKSANRQDVLNWLIYTGLVDNYIRKLEYSDIEEETIKDEI